MARSSSSGLRLREKLSQNIASSDLGTIWKAIAEPSPSLLNSMVHAWFTWCINVSPRLPKHPKRSARHNKHNAQYATYTCDQQTTRAPYTLHRTYSTITIAHTPSRPARTYTHTHTPSQHTLWLQALIRGSPKCCVS